MTSSGFLTSAGLARRLSICFGLSCFLLGLMVMVGWHASIRQLVQLTPDAVPMVYNTALGFFLSGLAVLLSNAGWLKSSRWLGLLVAVMGLLTILEYIWSIDLGFDQFFMTARLIPFNTIPGRMAPTTAVCWVMTGASLWMLADVASHRLRLFLPALLASLIAAIGLTTLLVQLQDSSATAYGWSNVTRMALQTGIGMGVLGVSLLATSASRTTASILSTDWLPVCASVVILVIVLGMWRALGEQERAYIGDSAQSSISFRQRFLRLELDDYVHDLERIANLWESSGLPLSQEMQNNAGLYLRQYPTMQALAWVDADLHIRWQTPADRLDLAPSIQAWSESFRTARDGRTTVLTRVLEQQGHSAFIVPFSRDNHFEGFLVAVIHTRQMLGMLLRNMSNKYVCSVVEDGMQIFSTQPGAAFTGNEWEKQAPLDVYHVAWLILVWPEPVQLASGRSHLPEVVLVGGAAMAFLIALTIYLGQSFALRARQVRDTNQSLEREIAERKVVDAALEKARWAAEAASEAKGRFLATMSHEIRTPMNGILGWTELTLDSPLQPEQRSWLEMVRDSGQGLLSILDDCLDVSKIEAGQLELESTSFELRHTIRQACALMAVRARDRGIELLYRVGSEVPDALVGDPVRLRQILLNLVSNAIKFTSQGGVYIEVKVVEPTGDENQAHRGGRPPVHEEGSPGTSECEDETAGDAGQTVCLCFQVKDTGMGIPADRMAAIFQPFTQGDNSTTRRFGGTGLGLTIARQLTEKMGGLLWVESTPDEGSTFFFTCRFVSRAGEAGILSFPEVAENLLHFLGPRAPQEAAQSVRRASSGRRLLLAEDNAINQKLAVTLLEKHGYVVSVAENGEAVLAALRRETFDLVLMDAEMPLLDGFETTAAIRHMEAGTSRHLPVVAVTAHAMSGLRARCLKAGMDGYLSKPFNPTELIDILDQLMPPLPSPAVDWRSALQSVEGSELLLSELTAMFLRDAPALIAQIGRSVLSGSLPQAAGLAHKLGGMMALFATREVRETVRRLETVARAGDETATMAGWSELHAMVGRMLDEMRARPAATADV